MTPITLNTQQIRDWVAEAGQIARNYFGNSDPEWKGIANPVTAADYEIEQLLKDRISAVYPAHGIIGEEYGGDGLDHEFLWAIDPIDGTRVFVEGLPSWCVTLALFHELKPVFGLVYLPLLDDWTYTEGDDVICNGKVVTHCLKTRWQADSYIYWRSDGHTLYDIHFTRIAAYGSTATHAAYMARGSGVATIAHDSYMWDIAAMAAFLAKQGGEIRYDNGDLLDFATIALNEPIHATYIGAHPDVIARLIPLLNRRPQPIGHPAW